MKVNLKQNEIQTALRNYISGQGISLLGKTVEMEFTAGRKSSGLSVEITIEDQPVLGTVELSTVSVSVDPAVGTDTTVTATVEVATVEEVQVLETKELAPAEEKTVVVTGNATSLFSS